MAHRKRVPLEQLPGLRGVGENEFLLNSEPIQGVFHTYRKTGQRSEPSRSLSGGVSILNPILRGSRNAAVATIWQGGARLRCAGITPD